MIFLPVNFHALRNDGIDGLSGIVGLDGQLATEPAVYQHAQFHFPRPAEIDQRIQRRTDGATGIQHIIYQDHLFIFNGKRNVSLVGYRQTVANVVAVERDIKYPILKRSIGSQAPDLLGNPFTQPHTPRLDADDAHLRQIRIVFKNLVTESLNCQCQLITG